MDPITAKIVLYTLIGSGFLLLVYHWKGVLYILWSAFKGLAIGAFICGLIIVLGAFLGGKM